MDMIINTVMLTFAMLRANDRRTVECVHSTQKKELNNDV